MQTTKRKKLNKRFLFANRLFFLGPRRPTWVRSFPAAITWFASLTTGTCTNSLSQILLTLITYYHPHWGSAEFAIPAIITLSNYQNAYGYLNHIIFRKMKLYIQLSKD